MDDLNASKHETLKTRPDDDLWSENEKRYGMSCDVARVGRPLAASTLAASIACEL